MSLLKFISVQSFYAGLKDGRITNDQFRASSTFPHYQPWFARLGRDDQFYDAWASYRRMQFQNIF